MYHVEARCPLEISLGHRKPSSMITFKWVAPRSLRKTFLSYKLAIGFLKNLHLKGAEKKLKLQWL
jgi:hypothetical protein